LLEGSEKGELLNVHYQSDSVLCPVGASDPALEAVDLKVYGCAWGAVIVEWASDL